MFSGSTVVLDGPLYSGGTGCCLGTHCAGHCTFIESFEVLTEVGPVHAGSFQYKVFFQNCGPCSTSATAQGCPRLLATSSGTR